MEYCTKCGAELAEKVEFCTKCGKQIKSSDELKKGIKDKKSIEEKIEETAEGIGKKAEKIGERIGEKADKIGKKIEKKTDTAGDHVNQWFDNTFKFAGPLVGACIGLIILRIIIYIIQDSGDDIHIFTAFSEGLLTYLLIIFASMLISGYNSYINRRYKQQYQWIYPFVSVVAFIIGAWVAAKIMLFIHESDTTPIIGAVGGFIDTYLIGIFIIALIIGYAAQYAYGPYTCQEK